MGVAAKQQILDCGDLSPLFVRSGRFETDEKRRQAAALQIGLQLSSALFACQYALRQRML